MEREQILMGQVKTGRSPAYQVTDKGKTLKMVSFIDSEGSILSGSYSQLHIASATDNYLNLEFTRHKVMVKGKFLAKVSRAIAAHRLAYLRESGGNPMAPDGAPAIDKITFVAKDGSVGNLIQQIAGECNHVEELTQYQS